MSFVSVGRVAIGLILGLVCVFAPGSAHAAQVTLAWDASTDQAVAGYKLYYGTASRNYTTSIDVKKVTSYTVTGLNDNTNYYFAATAYNEAKAESGFSNEVTYTTPTTTQTTCTYSLSSSAVSFGASAGTGSVTITAPGGCAWTSSGAPAWMTVTSGSSGAGNGTFIYSITANTTTASRSATLTIAGRTFTVTQAGTTPSYTITASATAGGSITPSGTVWVSQGGTKSFTIQSSSGYSLSDVKVNGVSVGKVTSFTFTNVTANHTIAATFAPINTYTLTVTKNGTGSGSVAVSPNQSTYPLGTPVTLTATPATGSSFTGWAGACSGPLNTCSLTMQSNKEVTAMFTVNTYSVKATATTGGTITPSGSILINYGASQTFTLTPIPGYKISNVRVDGVDVGAVSGFTFSNVKANHTIEALFSAAN